MAQQLTFRPVPAQEHTGTLHRRRITPEAGKALVILGHAIEYLADEYVHAGGSFSIGDAEVQAMQLLMALNRQVYFECPEVHTLRQRCWSWLHPRTA